MAYQKQTFVDHETVLTAAMLDHIEDGIVANETAVGNEAVARAAAIDDEAAARDASIASKAVRYDTPQDLGDIAKATARDNIGAISTSALGDEQTARENGDAATLASAKTYTDTKTANTLMYTAQTLNPDQQAQARANIGAVSSSDIPSGTVRYDAAQTLETYDKRQARTNIGAEMTDVVDVTPLELNGYYAYSSDATVLPEISESIYFGHSMTSCSPGDKFTVRGVNIGATVRFAAWVKANNEIQQITPPSGDSYAVVTAPEGALSLLFQRRVGSGASGKGNEAYKGVPAWLRLNAVESSLGTIGQAVTELGTDVGELETDVGELETSVGNLEPTVAQNTVEIGLHNSVTGVINYNDSQTIDTITFNGVTITRQGYRITLNGTDTTQDTNGITVRLTGSLYAKVGAPSRAEILANGYTLPELNNHMYRMSLKNLSGSVTTTGELPFIRGYASSTSNAGTKQVYYDGLSAFNDYYNYTGTGVTCFVLMYAPGTVFTDTVYEATIVDTEVASGMGDPIITVEGTAPDISAQAGVRYNCGTVDSVRFRPCVRGLCELVFTSGTTPAVLTFVPSNSVQMPPLWTGVEAGYTYEISIMDGKYGAVMAWPT